MRVSLVKVCPILLVGGRPQCARQSLASALSAPRVAATSYCDPGRHANVITACLLTIGNSRITFYHFIFRGFFLVIRSSWLTSKNSCRIISRNLSDLHLLPHLPRLSVIITSENSGGIIFRKDFMCITSKYSRRINIVIQAFRMVLPV